MRKRQVVVKRSEQLGGGMRRSSSSNNNEMNSRVVIGYGECQKNHAASIGGYAVDGCREFMASGVEGTTNALICAACGCHRNFHRRKELATEVVSESSSP